MLKLFDRPVLVVSGLTLLAALVRLATLGAKSLWLDEAVVWQIASQPLAEAIAENATRNSAPPLFIVLLRGFMLLGDSEFVLRLAPAIAGIAAIPAIYALARQFLEQTASYFTAALVGVTRSAVDFSQQVREYSLTFLMATLILLCFYRFLRAPSCRTWTPMALLFVLGIFTQYGLALLVLSLNVVWAVEWLFSGQERRRSALLWLFAQGAAAAAVAAVYFLSLRLQMTGAFGASYLADAYWNGTLYGLYNLAVWGTGKLLVFAYIMPGWTMWLFVGLILVGLGGALRSERARPLLLFFVVPMAMVFALALLRLYPYSGLRQTIFLTPMLYVLAGSGFAWLLARAPGRWVVGGLAALFIVLGSVHTVRLLRSEGNEHLRPLVEILKTELRDGDHIYVYNRALPAFSYYYREPEPARTAGYGEHTDLESYNGPLDAALASSGRVWLVLSHCIADECEYISEYAGRERAVELKGARTDAWLYLAQ